MKHALLRLYLDKADGVAARQLIEEHKDDQSSCFKYSLVLLEVRRIGPICVRMLPSALK